MPKTVSIEAAEDSFFELLDIVETGDEVIITRDEKPIAVLQSFRTESGREDHPMGLDSSRLGPKRL